MRSSTQLLAIVALTLVARVAPASEPDFSMIRYGNQIGCGLYVQFFKADGAEATKDGQSLAFFPGGAPPNTSPSACLAKCGEWATSSMVKDLKAVFSKTLGVTRVTGTCWLQGKALAEPQVLAN
jgi:hypothetical protein